MWRDGQTKRVFEYRFLASGTIEERIYQRQLAKEGLQTVVDDDNGTDKAKNETNLMSADQLRELFMYDEHELSSTHSSLKCKRCKEGAGGCKQVGKPDGGQLKLWAHHVGVQGLPDRIMAECGGDDVSFVFSNRVDGKKLDHDPEAEREGDVLSQIPESQREEVQEDSFLADSAEEGTSPASDAGGEGAAEEVEIGAEDEGAATGDGGEEEAESEDVILVDSGSDDDEEEEPVARPNRSRRDNSGGRRNNAAVISDSDDDEPGRSPLRPMDSNVRQTSASKRARESEQRPARAAAKRASRDSSVVSDSEEMSDSEFSESQ